MEVDTIEKLNIGPDDVILIKVPEETSANQLEEMAKYLRQYNEHHKARILVTLGHMDVKIMSSAELIRLRQEIEWLLR